MVLHARRLIFFHSSSFISKGLSSNAISNSCWLRTSLTSHCHILKLLVPSNFSTSNFAFEMVVFANDELAIFYLSTKVSIHFIQIVDLIDTNPTKKWSSILSPDGSGNHKSILAVDWSNFALTVLLADVNVLQRTAAGLLCWAGQT